MRVCIYVSIYIYICERERVCVYIYIYIYIDACIYVEVCCFVYVSSYLLIYLGYHEITYLFIHLQLKFKGFGPLPIWCPNSWQEVEKHLMPPSRISTGRQRLKLQHVFYAARRHPLVPLPNRGRPASQTGKKSPSCCPTCSLATCRSKTLHTVCSVFSREAFN